MVRHTDNDRVLLIDFCHCLLGSSAKKQENLFFLDLKKDIVFISDNKLIREQAGIFKLKHKIFTSNPPQNCSSFHLRTSRGNVAQPGGNIMWHN